MPPGRRRRRRRRRRDAAASPEPQRPTQAGDMFHWSILFPAAHWESPPVARDNVADDQIQSYKWLQARSGRSGTKGFLLIQQLAPLNRLLLVQDLHTDELLINKRVRKYLKTEHLATLYPDRKDTERSLIWRLQMYAHPIPGDIRFARLAGDHGDPRVEVHLPDEPYFQKLYAYGFPHDKVDGRLDHAMSRRRGEDEANEEVYNASLYYEYPNGGSLEHAIMRINRAGKETQYVEEPFIWHLIEQLGRALLFLHFGVERDGREPDDDNNWQAVCHRWLTMDNIMLHWPAEDEEGYDESAHGRLPRVALTNFDNAARRGEEPHNNGIIHFGRLSLPLDQIKEARYGVSPRDRVWQMEEPDTWQDVYAMGKLLRRIITDRSSQGEFMPKYGLSNWFNPRNHAPLEHYQQRPYSDRLIEAIQRFEITEPDEEGQMGEWSGNARFAQWEKPTYFNTAQRWMDLVREAEDHVTRFRDDLARGAVPAAQHAPAGTTVSILTVRPPDMRHYLMPFRTRKLREHDAKHEMVKLMASLNGPAYKVLVDYGPEHENARLAKTDKMREVEERRAAQEREMRERVDNMFQRRHVDELERGLQDDERQGYRERLLRRQNQEYRGETMRLVRKRLKKARRRLYGRREESEEEEGQEGDEQEEVEEQEGEEREEEEEQEVEEQEEGEEGQEGDQEAAESGE
ncbi:hypothetical protein QBC32DRAFT_11072 [Pseudoneurospora amorphoporcata]|uniref:Protein kinase domain-containing protein n=1 Tax=Pseudoneurospora amorphoporcata TaxID=241081 RepID=A0AAN6NRP9_9PEZI|nr:hypothetical protein QBC32DRAFT_11072 [Pseudoneurospora amorphoporcata]